MKDYVERVLISKEEIAEAVKRLGKQITEDYKDKNLFLICVLKGGFVFMADLIREIDLEFQMDFIAVSSYGASTKSSGVVRLIKDIDVPINDKHVIIVEDIVDTGLTLKYLKELFETRNPLSVKICSIFDKPSRRVTEIVPEYSGLTIPNEYVIGYGLDCGGLYRNLPDLCVLNEEYHKK